MISENLSQAEMEVIAGVLSAGGLGLNLLIQNLGDARQQMDIDDFLLSSEI
jgi:hypothetical protein